MIKQSRKTKTLKRIFVLIWPVLIVHSSYAQTSDIGKRFPSEKYTFTDRVTGQTITALTVPPANDSKIYQTHPQWTSDGNYIVFRSNRAADKTSQAFAVNEVTGDIIQLTDGPGTGTGSLNIARKSMRLYFFRGMRGTPQQLIELRLDSLFKDSEAGSMKDPSTYERIIMTMPEELRESGGFTLDADEKFAYIGIGFTKDFSHRDPADTAFYRRRRGMPIPQRPGGIRKIDLQTGEISTVIDVPSTMGHVQANPWVPGDIMYCNETGGDAPQRMWFVRADGTGNKALYKETPEEWITHETWVDADHVYFVAMAHLPRLRTKPTGIFSINVRTDEVRVLGQTDDGRGFWHCNGSSDGKWAVGDNFNGNIWLINCITGEQTLLTTDHKMKPDHAHPTFSPDNKRILFQSGLLSNGKSLNLMIVNISSG
jgi:oligogalacturonide lyase